ncbi:MULTISPECIES: response regulator transcription factor [Gammaproteobacteria]|uniref:Transcriptional regulator n=1 Tax=Xanthomonas boreopolis TaxID=86183 RepID=A0A919F6Y8_9XANT|nr:response regulator [Pseudomonas sp. Hp2]GHH51947.1 transcriptional regulator [[Pseudomonas] boreopolis]
MALESTPRLLLVEDDPISSGFFRIALEALPAEVDCCDSKASALALAAHHDYDLALIDVNLPDGNGTELLASLRDGHQHLPALAHTAELSADAQRDLRDNGFLDVLVKPLSTDRLLQAVRRGLTRSRTAALEATSSEHDWDEDAALLALNGQQGHLDALRELFLAELPATRDAIVSALELDDTQALRNHLHRLQASCGFVGAARLAGAVRQLRNDPRSSQARAAFHEAVSALLR